MPGAIRLFILPLLAVLLAEALARAGRLPLGLVRRRDTGPLAGWGLAYLAGLLTFGTGLFGLALAGILYPSTILGTLAALVLAGSAGLRPAGSWLARAGAGLRAIPVPGRALLAAVLFPLVLTLFTADFGQDTWQYHLGMPWHFLRAHRVLVSDLPLTFLTPLPFDLTNVLAILAGDDRLVQWTVFTCFSAAAAVFAAFALARGLKWEAVAGIAGVLAAGHAYRVAAWSKNDMGAVACFAAAFLLWRDRERLAALLFFGLALAAKFTTGPVIAAFLVVCLPGRLPSHLILPGTALLVAPILPWWIRSWLATGNPLFPFASQVIPTVNWDALNVKAFGDSVLDLAPDDTLSPGLLPRAWARHLVADHPLVALALPAMLLLSSRRRETAALVLGQFLTIATAHFPRYMLATGFAFTFSLALEASRLRGWAWRAALGTLALYGASRAWLGGLPSLAALGSAPLTARAAADSAQPLYGRLFDRLERLGARRVIVIGEFRSYRYPARVIWGGMGAETPIMWRLAMQSRNADEMAKRARQTGADRMVFNFITADWTAKPYRFYEWDDRTLALYLDFCGRWMDLGDPAPECDFISGGFHVYSFRRTPLKKAPAWLPFAPGTEGLYGENVVRLSRGDQAGGREAVRQVYERMPRVLHAANQLGHMLYMAGDWAGAMRMLGPSVRSGVIDAISVCEYGGAALNLGLIGEAEPALRAALPRYPSFVDNNLLSLATALVMKAQSSLNNGRTGPAAAALDEAGKLVDRVSGNPASAKSRRHTDAIVHGMRGELEAKLGRRAEALKEFTAALEKAPDNMMAPRWQSAINSLQYGN